MAISVHQEKGRFRESAIILAAFGVPALILLPVVRLRTEFRATLTVSSVSFRMAPWPSSDGLFNSSPPVDITLENFGRLDLDGPATLGPAGLQAREIRTASQDAWLTLVNVRLHSLDVSREQRITLDWRDKSLHIQIERDATPIGAVTASGPLHITCSECAFGARQQSGDLDLAFDGQRTMHFEGRKNRVAFVLRPRSRQLDAEKDIPLATHSSIRLERENGTPVIVGDTGKLELPEVARSVAIGAGDSVEIEDLVGGELSILPSDAGLRLQLHGDAKHIRRGSGALSLTDEAATPVEYLNAQPWIRLYLGTVALLGSTLLTVLNRFRIIKIEK